jgi:hypothetical protein
MMQLNTIAPLAATFTSLRRIWPDLDGNTIANYARNLIISDCTAMVAATGTLKRPEIYAVTLDSLDELERSSAAAPARTAPFPQTGRFDSLDGMKNHDCFSLSWIISCFVSSSIFAYLLDKRPRSSGTGSLRFPIPRYIYFYPYPFTFLFTLLSIFIFLLFLRKRSALVHLPPVTYCR